MLSGSGRRISRFTTITPEFGHDLRIDLRGRDDQPRPMKGIFVAMTVKN